MKEIWKPYQFYSKIYYVNQYGAVKNSNNQILHTFYNNDGYLRIQLCDSNHREERKIHRLVAELFCEKPDDISNYEVDHINGIRDDNYYMNLRWVTRDQNLKFLIDSGNHYTPDWSGSKNPRSKLSLDDVIFIRNLYDNNNMKISQIWKQYYKDVCTHNTIEHICKRKTWKSI